MTPQEIIRKLMQMMDDPDCPIAVEGMERHEDMGESVPIASFASCKQKPDGMFITLENGDEFEIIVR